MILRGSPPEEMCGVFVGSPAQLGMQEFTRCFARVALALAPLASDGSNLRPIEKMRWLLHTLPGRAQFVKLPVPRPRVTPDDPSTCHPCRVHVAGALGAETRARALRG